jgi:enamine deaminase RidA (YjgF/YER057c/UK114 family)
MTHTIINPPGLFDPAPYGFSHIVSAGRIVFIAGQGGEDPEGRYADGFEAQLTQAFANLATALRAADAEPRHVVKITTLLVNHDQGKLGPLSVAVRGLFGDHLPAQTLIPVPRLALDPMLFEVEAIAVLD